MAQQTLTGGNGTIGQTGTTVRGIINDNFTELYTAVDAKWNTSGVTTVTTPTITGDVTFNGEITQNKTYTSIDSARPVLNAWTFNVQPASPPAMTIDYHGIDTSMTASGNTNADTNLYPFEVTAGMSGAGTMGNMVNIFTNSRNISTGTVNSVTQIRQRVRNDSSGIISIVKSRSVEDPLNGGGGTITTYYADYINPLTTPTTSWGYYSLTSNNYIKGLALGDTPSGVLATSVMVDMKSTTKAPLLPRMTTTERDALTALSGMLIYNTTTGKLNVRGASAWEAVTSA